MATQGRNHNQINLLWLKTCICIAVLAIGTSPTIANHLDIAAEDLFAENYTTDIHLLDTYDEKPACTSLTYISKDFLKPPADSESLHGQKATYVKSLPAVPTTILMVLTGFFCISLVRDRRFWLAALAGILWAGQAGFQVFPNLAGCFAQKASSNHNTHSKLHVLCSHRNSSRLRSDFEGTSYIGLLYYLTGIPDSKSVFTDSDVVLKHFLFKLPCSKISRRTCNYSRKNMLLFPCVCIQPDRSSFNSLLSHLACFVQQAIPSKPLYLFKPWRGPPELSLS